MAPHCRSLTVRLLILEAIWLLISEVLQVPGRTAYGSSFQRFCRSLAVRLVILEVSGCETSKMRSRRAAEPPLAQRLLISEVSAETSKMTSRRNAGASHCSFAALRMRFRAAQDPSCSPWPFLRSICGSGYVPA